MASAAAKSVRLSVYPSPIVWFPTVLITQRGIFGQVTTTIFPTAPGRYCDTP